MTAVTSAGALGSGRRRRRLQGGAFRRDPGDPPEARLLRDPCGKLHGRGRAAAPAARGDPRALPAVAARRRPVDRLARAARPRASRAARRRSPSAISRRSSPSIWPGRRTRARSSTISCPCPTPKRRWSASASISTTCRARSGGRSCSKIPRPMSPSPRRRSARPNSWPRSSGAPAAACCSTSTTSSSARPITASTRVCYLADFPLAAVGEIHLAGYADDADDAGLPLLIDAHNSPVRDAVWALYAEAIRRLGPTPTLIEWDNDVPAWPALLGEARRAERVMAAATATSAERVDAV